MTKILSCEHMNKNYNELLQAAEYIEADLRGNADSKVLGTYILIEAHRIHFLLSVLDKIKERQI